MCLYTLRPITTWQFVPLLAPSPPRLHPPQPPSDTVDECDCPTAAWRLLDSPPNHPSRQKNNHNIKKLTNPDQPSCRGRYRQSADDTGLDCGLAWFGNWFCSRTWLRNIPPPTWTPLRSRLFGSSAERKTPCCRQSPGRETFPRRYLPLGWRPGGHRWYDRQRAHPLRSELCLARKRKNRSDHSRNAQRLAYFFFVRHMGVYQSILLKYLYLIRQQGAYFDSRTWTGSHYFRIGINAHALKRLTLKSWTWEEAVLRSWQCIIPK